MFKFLIRLDDACPTMNLQMWEKTLELLDEYNIRPIIGVIPDCKDEAEDFKHEYDDDFWHRVNQWQEKGYVIALHGLNHVFTALSNETITYQKNTEGITEFAGIDYEKQSLMIKEGLEILNKNGIKAECFFAPAHTFDKNTVKACIENGINTISDGYDFRVYKKDGMIFVPACFDTPHKMPFGLYTFVIHPSKGTEESLETLRCFLKTNAKHAADYHQLLNKNNYRRQSFAGLMMQQVIFFIRKLKK